jgi:hypothetical protein
LQLRRDGWLTLQEFAPTSIIVSSKQNTNFYHKGGSFEQGHNSTVHVSSYLDDITPQRLIRFRIQWNQSWRNMTPNYWKNQSESKTTIL